MPEPTPQQWAQRLRAQLTVQQAHAQIHDDIYTGARRLAVVESEYARTFGVRADREQLLQLTPPDTNVAAVGVDALSERLQVEDFSPSEDTGMATANSRVADAARRVWVGSDLDVMQSVATVEALIKGRAFLMQNIGPDGATLSVEDATQVAVARQSAPPYDVIAALKIAPDEWGGAPRSSLWLPGKRYDGVDGARSAVLNSPAGGGDPLVSAWGFGEGINVQGVGAAGGGVPFFELSYRQRLVADARSYLAPVASLADSYALLMAYLVIAARFGAVPVVTASGIKLGRDPRTGAVLPFGVDPARPDVPPRPIGAAESLVTEDPNGKFGRLDAGSLAGFIAAIEMLLSSITAITRVPAAYYGLGARSGTSGETVKASESGLERRKVDAQRYFGATWRRAMSSAVSADLGRQVRLTPRWANTETHIEAQDADAVGKYVAAGVDLQGALEKVGWPAAAIERAVAQAAANRAEGAALLAGIDAQIGQMSPGQASTVALTPEPPDPSDPALRVA